MRVAAAAFLVQFATVTLAVLASNLAESAQGLLWLGLLSRCHPYNDNSMLLGIVLSLVRVPVQDTIDKLLGYFSYPMAASSIDIARLVLHD